MHVSRRLNRPTAYVVCVTGNPVMSFNGLINWVNGWIQYFNAWLKRDDIRFAALESRVTKLEEGEMSEEQDIADIKAQYESLRGDLNSFVTGAQAKIDALTAQLAAGSTTPQSAIDLLNEMKTDHTNFLAAHPVSSSSSASGGGTSESSSGTGQ